jgi:hypothetical protein
LRLALGHTAAAIEDLEAAQRLNPALARSAHPDLQAARSRLDAEKKR